MVVVSYLVHYDTLLQNVTDIITKGGSYFITNCDKSLLQNESAFLFTKCDSLITKMRQLLQNATILLQNMTIVTKCDVYYEIRQCKVSSRIILVISN